MNASYDPRSSHLPRPSFGRAQPLEKREPPLAAICAKGECWLASAKDTHGDPINPTCAGRCRLSSDKEDPTLPQPPIV